METYTVTLYDMRDFHDPDEHWSITGFPTLELAKEFVRRWTRDSLEALRQPSLKPEELRRQFFDFGEGGETGDYVGTSELDFFIANPATTEERDWKEIKRLAGIS